MRISIETNIICDFPVCVCVGGGSRPPISSLDPHLVLITHLGKKRIISQPAQSMGLRPACAYAQSNQSLCQSLRYSMTLKLLTEHH